MGPERAESQPRQTETDQTLAIAQTLMILTERSEVHARAVVDALRNGQTVDPEELSATLLTVEGLNSTARRIVDEKGKRILERLRELAGTQPEKPKTFAELLKLVAEKVLPSDQDVFPKTALQKLLGDRRKTSKAIAGEGLPKNQQDFNRKEAIGIVLRFLTTPNVRLLERESYTHAQIRCAFFQAISIGQLEKWSAEIGHDWTQNPTIDRQTAMQIRGLVQLDKVLALQQRDKDNRD